MLPCSVNDSSLTNSALINTFCVRPVGLVGHVTVYGRKFRSIRLVIVRPIQSYRAQHSCCCKTSGARQPRDARNQETIPIPHSEIRQTEIPINRFRLVFCDARKMIRCGVKRLDKYYFNSAMKSGSGNGIRYDTIESLTWSE